ncbi:MAG TPA: PEFG-CTERM sorting domain-containing protein [Nitrososphaera sp.]|jgi:predicted secreted protein with PEFG-CTERM motif|nr:PEFG-CTERM sorting domain-containing protein [Nitrososphaera sp.]
MDNKVYALLAILLASVASVALIPAYAATTITAQTDKESYMAGDTIKITGKVTVDTGTVNQPILIQVLDPTGNRAKLDQVAAAADGSYTYTFPSGGPLMAKDGAYKVIATYKGISQTSTFDFTAGVQWKTFQLKVGDKSYPIQYMINGGSVTGMTIDGPTATLTVTISSTADGKLDIKLPRNVIDNRQNVTTGNDVEYAVFIDEVNTDATEATPTADMRQLSINFDNGSETVEIVGSTAIPEFGAIAAIVLAVAIVGIIVATARYSNKLNFTPRL